MPCGPRTERSRRGPLQVWPEQARCGLHAGSGLLDSTGKASPILSTVAIARSGWQERRPVDGPSPYALSVLAVVLQIPAGKVMTYGDVAEYLGTGSARTVGMVMSRHGSDVPWQRVVQASGSPAAPLAHEALELLRAEGCPVRGQKVVLGQARWEGT